MTYEEAIERLKKRICQEGVYREDKTYHFCTDGCMYAEEECEIAIAIKAIEKQIPKKPLLVPEGESKILTFKCPTCGLYRIRKFCDDCGQRISWSDE